MKAPGLGIFSLSLVFALLVAAFILAGCQERPVQVGSAGSAVKVMLKAGGHGSGTHLGGGFILTAAHVTGANETVKIMTDDGGIMDGEVLWNNVGYDVSVIYVEGMKGVAASHLSCDPSYVGQPITIVGNPIGTEFAKSWGHVAGLGKTGLEHIYGKFWRKLIALDITAAPGVSGAAVFNDEGEIIGILVAGQITARGSFPYSYMVPGPTLCHVLARVA